MLARALVGILPELTFEEALEVTKIHSVCGQLKGQGGRHRAHQAVSRATSGVPLSLR